MLGLKLIPGYQKMSVMISCLIQDGEIRAMFNSSIPEFHVFITYYYPNIRNQKMNDIINKSN